MKTKQIFKLIIFTLFLGGNSAVVFSQVTKEKTYKYDYVVDKAKSLEFNNQFGKMHIETWNSDKVQVDIIVSVSQRNESRADEMLDAISISASDSRSAVSIKTNINGKTNNKSGESFSIDYRIKMPKSNPLKAQHSFGDLYIADLDGNATIDISYGSIKAANLNGNNQIKVSFSNGEITRSSEGSMVIKYSNINIGSVGNHKLDQQFSDVEIDNATSLTIDAKYGSLNIGEIATIRGSAGFAGFKINKLTKLADLETTYGNGLDIRQLSPLFESVTLKGKFSGFSIAFSDDANANFDVSTEFCDLKARIDRITYQTRIKDMNKSQYQGKIGNGGGLIKINSSYGDVKFTN